MTKKSFYLQDIDLKGEIGTKIRQKRGKIKQKDFAKLVGVHKDQISRYETGKSIPRSDIYKRIIGWGETSEEGLIKEEKIPYHILTVEQKKLIDNVKEILESGNDTMIEALKHNIKAFLEAIRVTKNQNEDKGGD